MRKNSRKGMDAPPPPIGKVFSVFTDHVGKTHHFSYDTTVDLIIMQDGDGNETSQHGTTLEARKGGTWNLIRSGQWEGSKLRFSPTDLWLEACFESSRRLRALHSTAMVKQSLDQWLWEIKESGPKEPSPSGKRAKTPPKKDFRPE